MSNYNNLTDDERQKVTAAVAGLRFNKKADEPITRREINTAFRSATGKDLTQEYMRDPAVVNLMQQMTPPSYMEVKSPAQNYTYDKAGNRVYGRSTEPTTNTSDDNLPYSILGPKKGGSTFDKFGNRVPDKNSGSR